MTVTTTETVSVDGVVLNTLGYNLTTLTGRSGIPPRRGENVEVAYRQGRYWVAKSFDQRQETWSMFIVGADVNGLVPAQGARAQFNENLRLLKGMFGVRQRLLTLEKKLELVSGLVTLSAAAECVNTLDPSSMAGGTRAVFSADLVFPDPFWYRPQIIESIGSAGATVTHPGNVEATKMTIRFIGPLTNPQLTNTTRSPEVWVSYAGSVLAGQTIEIDTEAFTAVLGGGVNLVGNIRHEGSVWWMELLPGANVMTLTNSAGGALGAGTVEIEYQPPEL